MSSNKNRIAEFSVLVIVLLFVSTGCKKNWLDAKSNISLVVPSSLQDLQLLLDNTNIFNGRNAVLGEVGSDNYYLEPAYYGFMNDLVRKSYLWVSDLSEETKTLAEWYVPYQQIYYSNTILETIENIESDASTDKERNNIKGSALFFRAFAYYDLLQIFAKPYSKSSADEDLGLPLKLSTNIRELQPRSSVQETYNQVIDDLTQAAQLLLPDIPVYKSRPSKPAAYGLLARVFLAMEDYTNAFQYSDSCLKLYNILLDYNSLNPSIFQPIPKYSEEVIFHNEMAAFYMLFFPGFSLVDKALYSSYHEKDIRKKVFYNEDNGNITWKGNYSGDSYGPFNGIAVDEIYLIRAESSSRMGNVDAAMNDLNSLMINRWSTGEFTPFTALSSEDALRQILAERRKELPFRGLRWTDLRRLNKDARFAITLTRELEGQLYTLPPNDNRYVYPIPADEITHNGIPQNPR